MDGGTFGLWIKALKREYDEGVGFWFLVLVFGLGCIFHVGMIGLGWFVKYRDQFKSIKIIRSAQG